MNENFLRRAKDLIVLGDHTPTAENPRHGCGQGTPVGIVRETDPASGSPSRMSHGFFYKNNWIPIKYRKTKSGQAPTQEQLDEPIAFGVALVAQGTEGSRGPDTDPSRVTVTDNFTTQITRPATDTTSQTIEDVGQLTDAIHVVDAAAVVVIQDTDKKVGQVAAFPSKGSTSGKDGVKVAHWTDLLAFLAEGAGTTLRNAPDLLGLRGLHLLGDPENPAVGYVWALGKKSKPALASDPDAEILEGWIDEKGGAWRPFVAYKPLVPRDGKDGKDGKPGPQGPAGKNAPVPPGGGGGGNPPPPNPPWPLPPKNGLTGNPWFDPFLDPFLPEDAELTECSKPVPQGRDGDKGEYTFKPGTVSTRRHPDAGKTAIQPPFRPCFNPNGDQRQLLGGGIYAPGAPNVPPGGIRQTDKFDFGLWHTPTDVDNYIIKKQNQIIAFINERFEGGPNKVQHGGLFLPSQDPEKFRFDAFREGSVVAADTKIGRVTYKILQQVVKDRNGRKLLAPLTNDVVPERWYGDGFTDTTLGIYEEHLPRAARAALVFSRRERAFVFRRADLEVQGEHSVTAEDGSYNTFTTETGGALTITATDVTTNTQYARTLRKQAGSIAFTSDIPSVPTVSGASPYLPKFTGASAIGNSSVKDPGTTVSYGDLIEPDTKNNLWQKGNNLFSCPSRVYELRAYSGELDSSPFYSSRTVGSASLISDLTGSWGGVTVYGTGPAFATPGCAKLYYGNASAALRKVIQIPQVDGAKAIVYFRIKMDTVGGSQKAGYYFGMTDTAFSDIAAGVTEPTDGAFFAVDPYNFGDGNIRCVVRRAGSTDDLYDTGINYDDGNFHSYLIAQDFDRDSIVFEIDTVEVRVVSALLVADVAPAASVTALDNGSDGTMHIGHISMRLSETV